MLHKKTFQSLGRSDYQCQQCASVCQVLFFLKIIQFPFSFHLAKGRFGENPESVQDVIGDVYCPDKYCFNREKCESPGGYITTPKSIYGSGKCGAWLVIHKVPFILQEQLKTTKTHKTRFFFAK